MREIFAEYLRNCIPANLLERVCFKLARGLETDLADLLLRTLTFQDDGPAFGVLLELGVVVLRAIALGVGGLVLILG